MHCTLSQLCDAAAWERTGNGGARTHSRVGVLSAADLAISTAAAAVAVITAVEMWSVAVPGERRLLQKHFSSRIFFSAEERRDMALRYLATRRPGSVSHDARVRGAGL